MAGLTATKMYYEYTSGGVIGTPPTSPIRLDVTREYYIPNRIEISIYGDTIGIDLTNGSITYTKDSEGDIVEGVGNKPLSLSGNELLQDSATTNGVLTTKILAQNVLSQYAKGKETATLRCSISDYYDEKDEKEKVIDKLGNGKNMSFRLHDKVIPYIYLGNGNYAPMSKHQDGTAKVFEVVGTNLIYNGAVWQDLSLQEVLIESTERGNFILYDGSILMTSDGNIFQVKE